jgi:GntR family transcriptional regulator/MocR family aminotransferase
MSVQWAGLGPELLLRLDRAAGEPLRVQLERELRDAIRSGRLAGGERLPSSRELAGELGVSRGLVLEAYTQLQAEGYLVSRGGSATRVAEGAVEPPPVQDVAAAEPRYAIDFKPGTPDLTSFPRRDWAWAMREVLRSAPAEAFGYADPRGSERLRVVLAAYLRRVRGIVVDPARLLVCGGYSQGLNMVTAVLRRDHGLRDVAVEDPSYPEQRELLIAAGFSVSAVPVDACGVTAETLFAGRAGAVVLTPTHQSPTGVLLGPDRRQRVITWARERDGWIVEDDYDAEFRYDREPVGALQGLAPDRVAAIGTVSKSLAPALRLGWVVCPPDLAAAIADEKWRYDRSSQILDQLALALLIESGRYDKHLRRMRGFYAERRETLVAALALHAPELELSGIAAGFHAVLHLPDGVAEEHVVAACAEHSVRVYPMSNYRADGATDPPQLVVGFGNVSTGDIERGIRVIARATSARCT